MQNQPRVPGLTYKCLTCAGYLQHFQNLTYLHGLLMRLLHIIRKRFQPSRIESNPKSVFGRIFQSQTARSPSVRRSQSGKTIAKKLMKSSPSPRARSGKAAHRSSLNMSTHQKLPNRRHQRPHQLAVLQNSCGLGHVSPIKQTPRSNEKCEA